jgi:hypothetical protein
MRQIFEDRVATVMRVRGLLRPEAERVAYEIVLVDRLNDTHLNTPPNRCAWCGLTRRVRATSGLTGPTRAASRGYIPTAAGNHDEQAPRQRGRSAPQDGDHGTRRYPIQCDQPPR